MALTDPFFLFSIFLFIASLVVIGWSVKVLAQLRSVQSLSLQGRGQGEGPSVAAPLTQTLSPQAGRGETERIDRVEQTLQSLELSHVEALRMLGNRLDRIEASIQEVRTEHGKRISALETKTNETSSGTPQPAPQPPPFV